MTERMLSTAVLTALSLMNAMTVDAGASDSLFAAIREGNAARIRTAIQRGADVNALDSYGTPALMQAALYADAASLTLLLDHGANPNLADSFGATPLMWSIPDEKKVDLLLRRGAKVNAVSATGRTPLLIAAGLPRASRIVALLLGQGADPKARDKHGESAVLRAALSHEPDTMRLLLSRELDVNATDEDGLSPLMLAAGFADHKLADMLIARGANLNWKDGDGISALNAFDAVFYDFSMQRKLIARGADPQAEDKQGRTLLIAAAASDTTTPEVMRELLNLGYDPLKATKNLHGRTENAVDWARKRGDSAALRVLAPNGAAETDSQPDLRRLQASSLRESLGAALPVLLASGPELVKRSGCISCHHQFLPMVAYAIAREKGVTPNNDASRRNTLMVLSIVKPAANTFLESIAPPGGPLSAAYTVFGLAAGHHPADRSTDSLVHYIAGTQMPDGSWRAYADRPPIESGFFAATALSLHSLRLYPLPGRKAEFDERVSRAARWLSTAEPHTGDERAFRLLGLKWANADPADVRAAAQMLLEAQRPGGGWAQLKTLDSDAYATGQALYALQVSGQLSPQAAAYQRGLKFLLSTQLSDGSWLVRSRAYPVQTRYFDTHYPHGPNQWISAAGASWACIAIALSL